MALIREARRLLTLEAAVCRGTAIQLEHECGGETVMSELLNFRAAVLDLGAALLGQR